MMKELLQKIDEIMGGGAASETEASVTAEFPAMFLYVGDRAAESCPLIRERLKSRLKNSRSILHAALTASGAGERAETDFSVSIPMPASRGEALAYVTGNDDRLSEFNTAVKTAADRLLMSSGFPQTNRCFLFIVSDSDSPLCALLPEFVILFGETAHIRVTTCLFVSLSGAEDGFVSSAAFFRELEECRREDLVYDSRVMFREGQHITVHHEGAVFDAVFFLEMYRSDMKYSRRNTENNAEAAALTCVLLDKAEPETLPRSAFHTAGFSCAHKPDRTISHILYKSVIDVLAGGSSDEAAGIPAEKLFGYDVISSECDRVLMMLPDIDGIVSVMPRNGGDPDSVNNTNVRNILDHYGGADEDYFTDKYENACYRMIDCCNGIDTEGIFADYINKGTLTLNDAVKCLDHNGAVAECINEVISRLSSEEETLDSQLGELLDQPCPDLPHGLFSKPTGCDILAAAVRVKYGKKLEILKLRAAKRLAGNLLTRVSALAAQMTAAAAKIKALSDELTEDILRELYDDESTLTDGTAFTGHYAEVVRNTVSVADGAKELYYTLMDCGTRGTDGLTDAAFGIFRRLAAEPSVREIFAESFDKELYERYRGFGGGKDSGWVDARLVERLSETCRADLRYSVFQPNNSLFCMGNRDIGFVRKMLGYEDPAFLTVHVKDVSCASYEQLAVYGVPTIDSMVYAGECRKVYEGFVAAHGDSVYVDRGIS